jgi:hypothetical protein
MSRMQADTYRPKDDSQGGGGGGEKRPPRHVPNSGHYVETDDDLCEFYRTIGISEKNHIRCPRCLRKRDYEHKRRWRDCREMCPGCVGDAQHWGEVNYDNAHFSA